MDKNEPYHRFTLQNRRKFKRILVAEKKIRIFLKQNFFFLGLVLVFLLSGSLIFISAEKIKTMSPHSFSFNQKSKSNFYNKSIFISSVNNFLEDSPELNFLQKNTLVGASSPAIITSHILGSIFNKDDTETREKIVKYTVKKGDTISFIANKFNISIKTILWANKLNNSRLKIGEKLIILPVSGVLCTVRKGDTLDSIAKRYNADEEKIVSFNGISRKENICAGDLLIIPDGKMPRRISHIALTPIAKSYFIFPCQGIISQGLHYYNAIDIANSCGKPVVAASGGIVKKAGRIKIGGNRIIILHPNGVSTYYGHLSKILVSVGQRVNTGDIIGYIGNTGYTLGPTGCHLHFEVIGAKNFLAKYPVGTRISWNKKPFIKK